LFVAKVHQFGEEKLEEKAPFGFAQHVKLINNDDANIAKFAFVNKSAKK